MTHKPRAAGRRGGVVGAIAAITVITAATAVSPLTPAPAYAANCTTLKIVAVPGTTETNTNASTDKPVGLLASIPKLASAAAGMPIEAEFVNYAASAFITGASAESYSASAKGGVERTEEILRQSASQCPSTMFAVVGYSQGADVAGDVVAKIAQGNGAIPKSKLAGSVLFADPQRGTSGETVVGPDPEGDGALGPRQEGFGGVPVATICDTGDLYCATPPDQQLLSGVAQVLGNTTLAPSDEEPTSTTLPANKTDEALTQSLGSLDINGLTAGVKQLTEAASTGDTSAAKTAISQLQSTTSSLSSVSQNIDGSPAAQTLSEFSGSTSQGRASTVLGDIKNTDIAAISSLLSSLASAGDSLGGDQISSAASSLTELVAPLAGVGASDVAVTAGIVESIQPVALLRNAALVTDRVSRIDFAGIFTDLQALFDLAVSGRFTELPDKINSLNQKLVSIVAAIDAIDLSPLVTILSMIPMTETQIASLVLKVINNLDLTQLAQDVADIVKYVMAGQLLAVPPLVLSMFTTGLESSGLLSGVDLSAITTLTESFNPGSVVSAATKAVEFYSGTSHTGYDKLVVDDQGRTAIQWSAEWIGGFAKAA